MSENAISSGATLPADPIRADATLTTGPGTPGTPNLTSYPLLVFAPLQESHGHPSYRTHYSPEVHGPCMRLESNGIPVAEVVAAVKERGGDHAVVASELGTTLPHVSQAIAWHIANGGAV